MPSQPAKKKLESQAPKKPLVKKQVINKVARKVITLDAQDKSFGRVCSEAAKILMGKHKASFSKNRDMGDSVVIENSALLKFTGTKLEKKMYHHHSGFPGGLKTESLAHKFEKSVDKTVRDCVEGMLPNNRLRNERLKRLTVK